MDSSGVKQCLGPATVLGNVRSGTDLTTQGKLGKDQELINLIIIGQVLCLSL